MKIEDAKLIMDAYGRLHKRIKELALAKIVARESKVPPQRGPLVHALNYLELMSIWVEGEHIVASFDYNEPYSGTEEVIIQASELG